MNASLFFLHISAYYYSNRPTTFALDSFVVCMMFNARGGPISAADNLERLQLQLQLQPWLSIHPSTSASTASPRPLLYSTFVAHKNPHSDSSFI